MEKRPTPDFDLDWGERYFKRLEMPLPKPAPKITRTSTEEIAQRQEHVKP